MNSIATIEDLLEAAAGMSQHPKIQLDKEDITIMHSIARQVFKGTALTDRQFALMQEKLSKYKTQFINIHCDFDYAVKQLRQPLREIDRSKYIKICTSNDEIPLKGIDYNQKWIKIRFPFNKTTIVTVQDLQRTLTGSADYYHAKGTHEHYFSLNEISIHYIVTTFIEKNFEIDKELISISNEVETILKNKESYIPGIYNGVIKNLSPEALKNIEEELGDIESVPHIKIIDRHRRYGIKHIDKTLPVVDLQTEIAMRDKIELLCQPSKHDNRYLLESLYNLDRFPLLVVLDEANNLAERQLYECFNFFRHVMLHNEQSVLFRMSNASNTGASFNEYIKDNNLNNWVDKQTKVVYINNSKLPKLLISCDWVPNASIIFGNNVNRHVNSYVNTRCDLVILRDEYESPMRKYSNYYG